MNYIINPAWFYFMSVVDALKSLSIVLAIACGVFFVESLDACGEDAKKNKRISKSSLIFCIVCTVIAVFVPSKNTLMQIMVAKYATYDNASAAIQAVQNAADYIIESVGKLK